jgi:putative SOS response-associated peptidase YedK
MPIFMPINRDFPEISPNHRGRLHTCVLIENVILPPSSGFWDAFAGLWSRWRDIETEQEVLSATVIVTNANETLRPIHDRMPVVLEHENVAPWLSGEAGADLLIPVAEEKLTSWPVSTRVNKAGGADGATFIDRVS